MTTDTVHVKPTVYEPDVQSGYFLEASQVAAASSRIGCRVFDSRSPERFTGQVEPIDPIAGHIPGARNLPYAENLVDGKFKNVEELRGRFRSALSGLQPKNCVVYCGSGVTACHNLLAAAHAGLDGMKLYPGSWSEWITDPSRGVAR